ncbi:MAG: hypothetical protein RQ899_09350 [Pseudomonadales bacterium]|nr:hypothetical protein [Pseudomonadales bacterium]
MMKKISGYFVSALLTITAGIVLEDPVQAQFLAQNNRNNDPSRPAPRHPDGRINLSGPAGEIGNWEGNAGAVLFLNLKPNALDNPRLYLPSNLTIDEIPWQPWAREVYDARQASLTRDDPHTRCKPSGGPRMFHTPYGFEILQLEDAGEIVFLQVGAPHSWRRVFMDGRAHPEHPEPSWFGHSVGHWEGDTLVIDSVGFNDKFWMSREGVPHTTQLHLIERLTRTNFYTIEYEATVDDPGAYTAPWTGGWYINWVEGNEPFDYLCQENNRDAEHMIGPQAAAE